MQESSELDFDATLAAMLAFVGERVDVKISLLTPGGPAMTLAFLEGVLRGAQDRGPAQVLDLDDFAGEDGEPIDVEKHRAYMSGGHDSQFFAIGESGTGFYLEPGVFSAARWLGEEGTSGLSLELPGHVVVTVGRSLRTALGG